MNILRSIFIEPNFISKAIRKLIRITKLGSYENRLEISAVDRPNYGYIVYQAAHLAKSLGLKRISVVEFGVAGGNGLVSLEYHAREVEKIFSVDIDVYGFDTGGGLPMPVDYRDLPYAWKGGQFPMDIPALQERLTKAELVLGNVADTTKSFFEKYHPAPIGAIAFDLDFYSSTIAAFGIFDAQPHCFLPRLYCYFDDVVGTECELYNDFTGERLAIQEFNQIHEKRKFGQAHLIPRKIIAYWYSQIYICHLFDHPDYNKHVGPASTDLALTR